MNRRSFLASTGVLLAEQMLPCPAPVWAEKVGDIGPMNGSKFDTWTIVNQSWPKIDPCNCSRGGATA
jgi:hypothetical protein